MSLCAISAMLSSIFLISWHSFGRTTHSLIWSLAFAIATAKWLTDVIYHTIPGSLGHIYWPTVNAMAVMTATLALLGYRQRAGLKGNLWLLTGAGITVELLLLWVIYVQPHSGLSVALVPAYNALLLLLMIKSILAYRIKPLPAEWGATVVTFTFALVQLFAAGAGLMQGAEHDAYYMAIYSTINFIGMPAAFAGLGMFTILILASDMSETLKIQATTDQLTGLLNRRGFETHANLALSRSRRYGYELSLVVTDIDHFKKINDTHDHRTGDQALRFFADTLKKAMRLEDITCRLGGEEFVLLLPNTNRKEALILANRIKAMLSQSKIPNGLQDITMSASFGVTTLTATDKGIGDTLHRADKALYLAKQNGRDRVESI